TALACAHGNDVFCDGGASHAPEALFEEITGVSSGENQRQRLLARRGVPVPREGVELGRREVIVAGKERAPAVAADAAPRSHGGCCEVAEAPRVDVETQVVREDLRAEHLRFGSYS